MKIALAALGIAICLTPSTRAADSGVRQGQWPRSVLLTNDNGIEDVKLVELARAFSRVAETYVVAPLEDRSGTGSLISIERRPDFSVERRDLGPGIVAYGLDGYPADCVLFGALGLMKDPPDLVVSGINGGSNLGHRWFGSGTVGAARVAAAGRMRAIAVSGLNAGIPGSLQSATDWVVRLAQSPLVAGLRAGEYLTVSIPRIPPEQIRGIRVVPRDRWHPSHAPSIVPLDSPQPTGTRQRWALRGPLHAGPPAPTGDAEADQAGYIAIVPMTVDEVDHRRVPTLREQAPLLPAWPARIPAVPEP